MQWFEESDDFAHAARFRDISAGKVPDLSWARPADSDAAPSEAPAQARPTRSMTPAGGLELEGLRVRESIPARAPDVEPRRRDTMIDDIVPRAEEEAFGAIREAVSRAEAVREQQFSDAERRLVDLAMLVARRVIAREVSLDPGLVVGLVREGMAALGERDRIVVRVGTFYREMRDELQQKLGSTKLRCDVVIDPSLGRSGCIVETDLGRVDESVDARLENLIEALSAGSKRADPR
jgi:hypothetical protein